jgi:hypothetical protein
MIDESITKWFALTGPITRTAIDNAITALKMKGYDVCLLDRIEGGICFQYGGKDVGHDIRWYSRPSRTNFTLQDKYPKAEYDSLQPPWHDNNRLCMRFKTCSESPVSWSAAKVADVVDIFVKSCNLAENMIENEKRMYNADVDSDLAHNIFCEYDYKNARERWTLPHDWFPSCEDERVLKCHKCYAKKPPSEFLWREAIDCKYFTKMERVLYLYEMGCAPCCACCMMQATTCHTPRPSNSKYLAMYVRHVYKNECCICDGGCDGYDIMPSYNIQIHPSLSENSKKVKLSQLKRNQKTKQMKARKIY